MEVLENRKGSVAADTGDLLDGFESKIDRFEGG